MCILDSRPVLFTADGSGTISAWTLRGPGVSFGLLAAWRNTPGAFKDLHEAQVGGLSSAECLSF